MDVRIFLAILTLIFTAGSAHAHVHGYSSYVISDLGPAQSVNGLNESGDIVGQDGNGHATQFHRRHPPRDLTTLAGLRERCDALNAGVPFADVSVDAVGINKSGHILLQLGFSGPGEPASCVVLEHDGYLDVLDLTPNATATALNDQDLVIENYAYPGGTYGLVVNGNSPCVFNGTDGYTYSAQALNNRGQIAGSVTGSPQGPFGLPPDIALCKKSSFELMGSLGGNGSNARALNGRGDVAGSSALPGNAVVHAALFSHGKARDLNVFGASYSEATDINDQNEIVGVYANGSSGGAFLYDEGRPRNFNDLVHRRDPLRRFVSFGYDPHVNNRGVIAVIGTDSRSGKTHLYTLTPVRLALRERLEDLDESLHANASAWQLWHAIEAAIAYGERGDRDATCAMLSGAISTINRIGTHEFGGKRAAQLLADLQAVATESDCD